MPWLPHCCRAAVEQESYMPEYMSNIGSSSSIRFVASRALYMHS